MTYISPVTDAISAVQSFDHTVIKVAMGMGIFDALAASNGAEITADELDAKTKGDRQLLGI